MPARTSLTAVFVCSFLNSTFAIAPTPATPSIIFVDDDAPAGGDGVSWATAFRFLADGLDTAVDGSEIRIAGGAYLPDRSEDTPLGSGDQESTFATRTGLVLKGGFAGIGAGDPDERDPATYPTVLSGDLAGDDESGQITDNSFHVVTSETNDGVVLDGLTISGGNAVDQGGGGVLLSGGRLTMIDTIVADNRALFGGGLRAHAAELIISGSRFETNRGGLGAGILASSATVNITSSSFSYNIGRGLRVGGGTLLVNDCSFTENSRGGCEFDGDLTDAILSDCVFARNDADQGGGAILIRAPATLSVNDCEFTKNTSPRDGGAIRGNVQTITRCTFDQNDARWGGAISGSVKEIADSTFSANTAQVTGGAIRLMFGFVRAHRTTFCANTAPAGGAASLSFDASAEFDDVDFLDNVADIGGAIHVVDSGLDLKACTLEGNEATLGGAVYADSAIIDVLECAFVGNSALLDANGINALDCGLEIRDSRFDERREALTLVLCSATMEGSRIFGDIECADGTFDAENCLFWDPLASEDCTTTVTGCTFLGGHAQFGGGMSNRSTLATVRRCSFVSCSAVAQGAAISNQASEAIVVNSTLLACWANSGVGVIQNDASQLTMINCTLAENYSVKALVNQNESVATVENCIFWRNDADLEGAGIDVRYSRIVGTPGPGNIENELFFFWDAYELRLWPGSRVTDAGDNDAVPADVTTDRDGNDRFVDDPETEDTGNGAPPLVDMGAYEYRAGFPCREDLNRDGMVGLTDLLRVLDGWGDGCTGCPADIDRSGIVGFSDVMIVLAAWGPCAAGPGGAPGS